MASFGVVVLPPFWIATGCRFCWRQDSRQQPRTV